MIARYPLFAEKVYENTLFVFVRLLICSERIYIFGMMRVSLKKNGAKSHILKEFPPCNLF